MTWDPYGMPNSPTAGPDDHQHRRLPQQQPASLKAIAAILGGMALLALVFTVAAEAQEDTDTKKAPEAAAQEESTATAKRESETAAKKEEESATTGQTQSAQSEEQATESAEATPGPVVGQMVEQPEGTYAASEYVGQSVMSAEGENIGQISDLIITADHRVVGVVIGVGGFLGIGEKPIAVEFDRLSRTTTQDGTEQLALNYTRTELENAPAFVSLADQKRQAEAEQARQQQEQLQQEQGSDQSY